MRREVRRTPSLHAASMNAANPKVELAAVTRTCDPLHKLAKEGGIRSLESQHPQPVQEAARQDQQTETPATQHPMIPHSLSPQKRKTASACWREHQQAWESQGSWKLRKQSKGRSRSLDSCGERREQRKPLWPPPQPHGIKADAPAKYCHTVEEGGAPSKAGVGIAEGKTPWNHTSCAAQEETTEQHLGRAEATALEKCGVLWTPQRSQTRRIHHPLLQTHARIYNNTARRTTSW